MPQAIKAPRSEFPVVGLRCRQRGLSPLTASHTKAPLCSLCVMCVGEEVLILKRTSTRNVLHVAFSLLQRCLEARDQGYNRQPTRL